MSRKKTLIVLSSKERARRRQFGEKRRLRMSSETLRVRVWFSLRRGVVRLVPGISSCTMVKAQNFAVLSALPVVTYLPSGCTCSVQIAPVWASTVSSWEEEAMSKSSREPDFVPTTT